MTHLPVHPSTQAAFRFFQHTLAQAGLRPALAYLLSLTAFRYIAVFCNQGDEATAAVFYDRQQPAQLRTDEVPFCATYCHLACETRTVFETADSVQDPRLADHPARLAVRAYWGLPIITPEGRIQGTLCLYDVVPREPATVNLELMLAAASTLQQQGLVPPYPKAGSSSAVIS